MYFCIKWTISENSLDTWLTNRNVFLWVLQWLTLGTLLIEHSVWVKHLSQDAYFKCTHKCLLFNWIILILSYTLIGYLIADIHIYKLLIYPICEGIYYTDRISDLYSYILYPIGQALWNRDRIYIVIDICPISEEI